MFNDPQAWGRGGELPQDGGPGGADLVAFGVLICPPGSSGIEGPGWPPCNGIGPGPRGQPGRGHTRSTASTPISQGGLQDLLQVGCLSLESGDAGPLLPEPLNVPQRGTLPQREADLGRKEAVSQPVVPSTLEGPWASQRPEVDVSASPHTPVSCTAPQFHHLLLQAVAQGGPPGGAPKGRNCWPTDPGLILSQPPCPPVLGHR